LSSGSRGKDDEGREAGPSKRRGIEAVADPNPSKRRKH
jgi:hypothetical protein